MKLRSRGLTLIELVVVLAILAAVAGIVAPLLPNMQRRAHKATEATQAVEVAKAIQLYQGTNNGEYPSNFDLLTDGSAFPSYMPADDGNTFGGYATVGNLTDAEVTALTKAGIRNVHTLASSTSGTGFHPTINPYAGTTSTTVSTSLSFAIISPTNTNLPTTFLASARTDDTTGRYVVLGVGTRSSMVGTVMQDAPTIAPGGAGLTPANSYSRVGAIFKVSGNDVERSNRARFIGAVILEDDALETAEEGIVDYYGLTQQAGTSGS